MMSLKLRNILRQKFVIYIEDPKSNFGEVNSE